ncbi:anti-sigma factor family protein [Kitasatospora gansuensis]
MTPSWTEAGHPDVELLADLAEDLTDPAELPLLRAHLADCAECADTYAALAEVRELLGSVEDFPPLPAELGDRIDAALAVEAAVPVTPAADPDAPLTRRPAGPAVASGAGAVRCWRPPPASPSWAWAAPCSASSRRPPAPTPARRRAPPPSSRPRPPGLWSSPTPNWPVRSACWPGAPRPGPTARARRTPPSRRPHSAPGPTPSPR